MAIWQTEGKRVKKKPENHMRQVEGAGAGEGGGGNRQKIILCEVYE